MSEKTAKKTRRVRGNFLPTVQPSFTLMSCYTRTPAPAPTWPEDDEHLTLEEMLRIDLEIKRYHAKNPPTAKPNSPLHSPVAANDNTGTHATPHSDVVLSHANGESAMDRTTTSPEDSSPEARPEPMDVQHAILSDSPTQWLNDVQMANAQHLQNAAIGVKLYYPCPKSVVMEQVKEGKGLHAALRGESETKSILQAYVSAHHWLNLIFDSENKRAYYFEPYGRKLEADDPLVRRLHRLLKRQDMLLIDMRIKLQTDGHSCGLWSLILSEAWVKYVSHPDSDRGRFRAFFLTWLNKQGVANLNDCGTDIRNIRKANSAFIKKKRDTLREDLRAAAREGTLRWSQEPVVNW